MYAVEEKLEEEEEPEKKVDNKKNSTGVIMKLLTNVNTFVIELSKFILKFIFLLLMILILILIMFVFNVINYVDDLVLQLFIKSVVFTLILLVEMKIDKSKLFSTDRSKKIVFIIIMIIINILAILDVTKAINENTFEASRLFICITIPWLLMMISLIINDKSIIPAIIIILAFIVGLTMLIVNIFVDIGLWKYSIIISSTIYIVIGLCVIIYLIVRAKTIDDGRLQDNMKKVEVEEEGVKGIEMQKVP